MDEIDVFNRALSLAEIQSIFNAGTAGKFKGQVHPEFGVYNIADPQSYVGATFVAPNSAVPPQPATTVIEYARACGFDHFNWQNQITHNSAARAGSDVEPRNPGPLIASGNVAYFGIPVSPQDNHCISDWIGCSLIAPPTFFDPPQGSYTYLQFLWNPYPYYIPSALPNLLVPGACLVPGGCPPLRNVISLDGTTLSFADAPNLSHLSGETPSTFPSGAFIAFATALVGVDSLGNAHSFGAAASFTWNSTFNGRAGGVHQTALAHLTDPGSGTGGVTITGIGGVALPPVVPIDQVATTASGLVYSRVSQTFNGTVTIRNTSSRGISGPLQILFFGMPATATLMNATRNITGTPYLTVPVASLAPGQSTTVTVQFKNPSNVAITLNPVVYAGSIN